MYKTNNDGARYTFDDSYPVELAADEEVKSISPDVLIRLFPPFWSAKMHLCTLNLATFLPKQHMLVLESHSVHFLSFCGLSRVFSGQKRHQSWDKSFCKV